MSKPKLKRAEEEKSQEMGKDTFGLFTRDLAVIQLKILKDRLK